PASRLPPPASRLVGAGADADADADDCMVSSGRGPYRLTSRSSMPKPSPALTRPQLAQLTRAALDNSGALLDDARLLFTFKLWPRAHVLAILAEEEFGKFYLCIMAGLQLESADAATWTKFWSKFSDHQPKFAAW
ncbi:AbiV family abortive infection protein, partial [Actinophytocola sediminis]